MKEIRNNFFIFIFVWTTYSVTHNDIFIELGTLGGNLYANICLISSLEVLSSFVTGIIMMRIEAAKSLKLFAGLCGLVFFSFFFYSMNPDNEEDSSFIHYIYLILLMLGKLFAEIVNNLIYVYAPKYLTDQFVSFFLVNIRLFARIFLIFLPAIDEFFDVIGVHVFTFISLLWILGRIVLSFIHEKEQESIPELCHDYAVFKNLLNLKF